MSTSVTSNGPIQSLAAKEPSVLLDMLETCPSAIFESVVREIMNRLCSTLGVVNYTLRPERSGRMQTVTMDRPNLRLRGFGGESTHILFLGEESREWTTINSATWSRVVDPNSLPIIIPCSDKLRPAIRKQIGINYALVPSHHELITLLSGSAGLEAFKSILREHFLPNQLHPFDDQHAVTGAFFIGRRSYLDRLANETRNYTLIAPSGIGKSSLVGEYQRWLRGKAARETRYASLYGQPVTDESVFQVLLRMLEGSTKETYYADPSWEMLKHYIAVHNSRAVSRVEFFLDEVDDHVHLPAFAKLAESAKQGLFRLVLIGRWNLCKACRHDTKGVLDHFEEMRLEALTQAESEDLVFTALRDLKFEFKSVESALKAEIRRLGHVPASLHDFGRLLVGIVQARGGRVVTAEHVEMVGQHIAKSHRISGVLKDSTDDVTRIGALLVLLQQGDFAQDFGPNEMRANLIRQGIMCDIDRSREICDELVILHALVEKEADIYRVGAWRGAGLNNAQRSTYMNQLHELVTRATATKP